MTTGLIIYGIVSVFFTLFIIGLIKGGNPDRDEEDPTGNFEDLITNLTPADTPFLHAARAKRFEESN